MTSQLAKQAIALYIWPNILRGTGNQTMKCGHEKSPRPFSKKSKLSISLDH